MDKLKNKGDLRAAGKKRLEEFRQKKQQKGGAKKGSSTGIKEVADDKSVSGISVAPVSPVTKQDTKSHQKAGRPGRNVAGTLELGVEAPQQVQSSRADNPGPSDSKLETPLTTGRKSAERDPLLGLSEAVNSSESQTTSESADALDPSDHNGGRERDNKGDETPKRSTHSKISPPVSLAQFLQREHSTDEFFSETSQGNISSNNLDIEESVKQNFITEIESLKREVGMVVEQKELVSNQLVVKAKQQLEDADRVRSLIADMESIQHELRSEKTEKAQLVEEFNLSQMGLQDTNQRLAAELQASQEQVVAANHRASLLAEELERSKQEVVKAATESATERESMQRLLKDGEVRIAQLMEELVTTKSILQGVLDEKTFLNHELQRFENELHAHGNNLLQKGTELEASKQQIQTLEKNLASEQTTLQQVQKLVTEKSEIVEAARVSNEKLEALLLAKEVELGANGDQIRSVQSEKDQLVQQVEEFKLQLDLAKQKEEEVRAAFEAHYMANEERLKQLQDEKAGLLDSLEKSDFLSKKLSDERSILLAAFEADREQLRQDLRQKEEENVTLSTQLEELRQELQELGKEHSQIVKEIEIALDGCKIVHDRESDKSKAKLVSTRDQLLFFVEDKRQEVANLGNQLQNYKDQLSAKVEQNSSLMMLLEESNGKLQETANRVSEFEADLKKHKAVSDGLLEEKQTLAGEVLEFQAHRKHMQQTAKEHESELERVREALRELNEDHSKLSGQHTLTAEKLTGIQAEKSAVEVELATYKERMTQLVEENSTLVKSLEDTQNDLQRASEDNMLSSSDHSSELDKHRELFSDLLVEKEGLVSELQLAFEQSKNLKQQLAESEKKYIVELEEVRNNLRQLEDSHSKLLDDLTVSRREMAKLMDEKSVAELALASSKEQLMNLEDSHKGLSGALDKHREELDAVLQEKERMLGDHVAELDNLRELQRVAEETTTQQTAYLQRMESIVGETKELERKLKEDNVLLKTELEGQTERQQAMLEDKVKEIGKLQEQVKELVQLQEQMAREVAETHERSQALEGARVELQSNADVLYQELSKISSEKNLLQQDLEFSKEQLQEVHDEKGNLILKVEVALENWKVEKLQLSRDLEVSLENGRLLSAAKLQVDSEMEELMLKIYELDAQRVTVAMEAVALKESIESSEEQRARLASQVDSKERLLQTLVEEKSQLNSHLEREREQVGVYSKQVLQFEEDLRAAKLKIQELELETTQLMSEFKYSQKQVELLTEEKSALVEDLSSHLSNDEKLKKAIDENLQLRDVREQLEEKLHELDTAFVRVNELENQVTELTERVSHIQEEKGTALEALSSTQEELGQSINHVADADARLRVLEGTVTALQAERDELAGKLEVTEQNRTHLAERALQDSEDKLSLKNQLAAFEVQVADYDIALSNQKDMVSQSNLLVQSLVHNLEDLIRNVFPEAEQDFVPLHHDKVSAEYQNSLVRRLHIETTEVCRQLQNAHVQLSEMNQQSQQAQNQLMTLQEQNTAAVESAAEMRSQYMKAVEEKEMLQTSLKRLEAMISAENLKKNEQAVTFANLQSERDELAAKLESLEQNHIHVSERAIQGSKDNASLQDQVAALELQVAEWGTELSKHKEMLIESNSLVLSLVNKLEDLICDAFPEAGQELLSSQYDKCSSEYHHLLISRLHIEATQVCQRLKNALDMSTGVEEQLAKTVDALQEEKTLAAEKEEQIRSQLMKVVAEKEVLESQLARMDVIRGENVSMDDQVSSLAKEAKSEAESLVLQVESLSKPRETVNLEEASLQPGANAVANQAASDCARLVLQIESLNKQLEDTNAEKESLQSALAETKQKLSATREKLSLAVNKGKAVVQQRDAWKLALAEKSRELEEAENKIVDLAASVEQMARLKIQLNAFENKLTTVDQVILENEHLFHSLSAVLNNGSLPGDWNSISIANKMRWVTSCLSTLLLELQAKSNEVLMLIGHEATLKSSVEQSDAKATAIANQLRLVEHEKQSLFAKVEEVSNDLHLERAQMTQEKSQLISIIRQQDLNIETHKREQENLATRLEERNKEIVRLEAEIASLVTKVTEQESELNTQALSYHGLDATLKTLFSDLNDCYETISPAEIDSVSGDSPLDRCKHIVKLLIDKQNLTGGKLKEILDKVYLLGPENAVKDSLYQSIADKASSKVISSGLIEIVDEAFTSLDHQVSSLAEERNEKNRLQLELTRKEEIANGRLEKLNAAVTKGKTLVQQRDSLKKALMDKHVELETLVASHKEELESKELSLQEAGNRLASSLEHAAGLENDIVSFQNSVASDPDPLAIDMVSEMDRRLSETQHRASAAESEAENARNEAAVLASRLELSQTQLGNLVEQVNTLTNDKSELVQILESSGRKYSFEVQELRLEMTQLISETTSLQQELLVRKEDREKLVQNYEEATDKCGELMYEISRLQEELVMQKEEKGKLVQDYEEASDETSELRSQTEELARERAIILNESKILQERIAELETALEAEARARMKLESYTEAFVGRIQHSTKRTVMEKSVSTLTPNPHDFQSSSQVDSMSPLLVVKLEAALTEIEELSNQHVLLAESQRTMMEKTLSEREMFDHLQQRLASMGLDLSEACKKLEEADSRREREEAAAKGFLEEVHILREELAKASRERDALRSELVQSEEKGAITREKLGLAIKKGKNVTQQRDALKQSLSEQQALLTTYSDEIQTKDSALKKATEQLSMVEAKAQAWELNVSSLHGYVSTLEQELQDKTSLIKIIEACLTKWDFPSEWQSRHIIEKLEWLVAALSNAQNTLVVASQEKDALKEASTRLTAELTDAQTRANLEQQSSSMLNLQLEESMGRLKQSQERIAELETLMAEVGVSQETERLAIEVSDLGKSLEQKQAEVNSAEKAVMAWIERSEESDKYIQLCQERISELETSVQESNGAEQQIKLLHDKIAHLEEAVEQKEESVKAVETSRGKAINKLTLTTNKFRELYQQSENLVAELERMQKSLQEKDVEISRLTEEVMKISSESQILQEALKSKRAFQLQLEDLLKASVFSGTDSLASPARAEHEGSDHFAEGKSDEERCIAHVRFLQNLLSGLTRQSQAQQADLERKDFQLKGLRGEIDEIAAEKTLLKANMQREQNQIERLKAEVASMHDPFTGRDAIQANEIEEVQVGTRLLPVKATTPHVRGTRRPTPVDVAINVDSEMNQLLVEFDDKGHGFKSLKTSRFMPRGTRAVGEQIDRLCVAGGKLLMRQPAARLLAALYWLAIHIWMVFLITAAHV